MENFEPVSYEQPEANEDLRLTEESLFNLDGAAKWAKIVSIISLSSLVLLFLFMLFIVLLTSGYRGMFVIVLYTVILGIGALPYYFMYKFGAQIKEALSMKRTYLIEEGLASLKNLFLTIAIFMIISIAIYVILILITLLVGGSMLGNYGSFF